MLQTVKWVRTNKYFLSDGLENVSVKIFLGSLYCFSHYFMEQTIKIALLFLLFTL
jgi:hypothetical protein